MDIFKPNKNSWMLSAQNVQFKNNILEAELKNMNNEWVYNKLEIIDLLLNKNLVNDNGHFKYSLTKEEDKNIMNEIFCIYKGPVLDCIDIDECCLLSIDQTKYNIRRNKTISILSKYKLPLITGHYGHTPETEKNSEFYKYMKNKDRKNYLTIGMLEIFNNFVKKYKNIEDDAWLLYFEDDVRPFNIKPDDDLTKLYNVPVDAELIRPSIGLNKACNLENVNYKISFGGKNNHAFYISLSGCEKVLNYVKNYGWRFDYDIDLYKLGKECRGYPTGFDGWTLAATDNQNEISDLLTDDEKINMYSMNESIFN